MTDWYLTIDPAGHAGATNMAIDASLLRQAQEGSAFLRLYRWDPPCLSLGRNEPATTRYDLDQIRALGLDMVRRPTGGRAVWHEHELTYAIAAPSDLFGSLQEAYISIHQMLADGLRSLGARVELAPRSQGPPIGPGGGACFASLAGGEIVVDGLKLVGSAQVREGNAFLQHGSVLLRDAQDIVARVTRGSNAAPSATSLCAVLERDVVFEAVATAIANAARERWAGSWTTADVSCSADDLVRFENPDWTLRR